MPPPDQLTRDYHEAGPQGETRPEHVKVALVAGPSPRPAAEIEALLRRRLRFVGLVSAAMWAIGSVLHAIQIPMAVQPLTELWLGVSSIWALFLVVALVTGLLWSRLPLSLGSLRALELFLFGMPLAYVAWWDIDQLGANHLLLRTFRVNVLYVPFTLSTVALFFLVSIVAYGTLIPNTARRCSLVVTVMAVVPLALVATVGFSEVEIRAQFLAPFLISLAIVGMWMGVAVALAVYGSHRVEILRREVQAARQMGQYRLKERLGAGGMGEVYMAEHVLLRRPCALKLIRPGQAGDPQHLLRFEREVQATAALTHPNTVQVYDYGHADDGTFYYAMEYLPGLNLHDLVQRHGPLPPDLVVHLLLQVCGALHEAHAAGLIHRDIKPNNVIACDRGGLHDVAKLLDFGLVRSHTSGDAANLTVEGGLAGTPAYMSPEQADGKPLDSRSDIYSLGALAYYLLTGQPPFVRPTHLQTLLAHLKDDPVPPDRLRPDAPADLQAVVLRCLEKDPGRRFADVRGLARALTGCGAAGQWTEERAAAWRRDSRGAASDMVAPAPTRGLKGEE